MTDQTPTNLTEQERDELEEALWGGRIYDDVPLLVARIKADAYAAGLAAREAHTNTARAGVERLIGHYRSHAGVSQFGKVYSNVADDLQELLDAAPAPTDNKHDDELADRVRALATEWSATDNFEYQRQAMALRAVVDGPTTPTQESAQ